MPDSEKLKNFYVSSARIEELDDDSYVVEVHYSPNKSSEDSKGAMRYMEPARYSAPSLDKALSLIRSAYDGEDEESTGARKFMSKVAAGSKKKKESDE